jgi:hypothetical protein
MSISLVDNFSIFAFPSHADISETILILNYHNEIPCFRSAGINSPIS